MSLEFNITLRYFRSKKRNIFISVLTFISILGVLIGVASLICVNSVVRGFEMEIKEKILENEPHILILPKNSEVEDEKFYDTIYKIQKHKQIETITPYVSSTVLISSYNNLNAVKLTGIEPKMAEKSYGIFRNLKRGSLDFINSPDDAYFYGKKQENEYYIKIKQKEYDTNKNLSEDEKKELLEEIKELKAEVITPPSQKLTCVYLGRALSESLTLKVGDSLKLMTPFGDIGPMGMMPKSKKFRICGIFFTSLYEFDQYNIYMPINEAKKFLGISQISGVEIKIKDIYKSDKLVKYIEKKIDLNSFKVAGFSQLNKNLFSALQVEKFGMFLLLTLVMLVASFNIIATLTLIINSKKKEISILKSLGMTNGSIRKIFLYKGVIIGIIGIILGSAIGLIVAKFLSNYKMNEQVYYIPNLPVRIELSEVLLIVITTFVVTVIATIIPANKAAKITPVYGLKGE